MLLTANEACGFKMLEIIIGPNTSIDPIFLFSH